MSEFERSVWKEISIWQTEKRTLVSNPIQGYWDEYFASCEMSQPETGLETFN